MRWRDLALPEWNERDPARDVDQANVPCRVHRRLHRLHEGHDQQLTLGAWELAPPLVDALAGSVRTLDDAERRALGVVPIWQLRYGIGRHAETRDTLGRPMLWSVFAEDVVSCGPGGGSIAPTSHAQAFFIDDDVAVGVALRVVGPDAAFRVERDLIALLSDALDEP